MISGIYQIRNVQNGKCYVGSAVSLRRRKAVHFYELRKGKHHSAKLQNAYGKHGEEAFVFEPLFICAKGMLLFYEQRALDVLTPAYNIVKTAGSRMGHKVSEETRAKMRAAIKARAVPWSRGWKAPEEIKEQMRNRAAARKAANGGRMNTPEARAKMSAAATGKKKAPEAVAKTAAALRGRPRAPEVVLRVAAARAAVGHIFTPEHRAKLSAAASARYAKLRKAQND